MSHSGFFEDDVLVYSFTKTKMCLIIPYEEKKNHNKLLKNFHPKSLEITDNNNNSCCHTEFKELNCTQWSASVTIFGTVSKQMNCDRI